MKETLDEVKLFYKFQNGNKTEDMNEFENIEKTEDINEIENAEDINESEGSKKKKKAYVSILGIFEICILAFGVIISFSSTVKPLKYTLDFIWCFAFPLVGIVFIVPLILLIKKRFVWIIGFILILLYIYVGGAGAFICELNASRLKRVSFFEGKNITMELNNDSYAWDGKSVSYDSNSLKYFCRTGSGLDDAKVYVDGEREDFSLYDNKSDDNIYMEIYGGGTGIYLILEPVN